MQTLEEVKAAAALILDKIRFMVYSGVVKMRDVRKLTRREVIVLASSHQNKTAYEKLCRLYSV